MPLLRSLRNALAALALGAPALAAPTSLSAQARDSARVIAPDRPASWHLTASGYYSSATNGFGVWTGQDVRLLYSGSKASPWVSMGSQQRPDGHQEVLGVGSYITLTKWAFAIVGMGTAPEGTAVLFPRLRSDASLFVAVPKLPGVLISSGITDLRYKDSRAGGRIVSVGPTVYRGRGIYNGAVFFNKDRASGARSHAWQAGGQWGTQGRFWIGGGIGAGNEAYRLLSATPFDARFQSRFASAFVSKWVTPRSGVSVRLDYENKVDVFQRRAIGLSYFVDF